MLSKTLELEISKLKDRVKHLEHLEHTKKWKMKELREVKECLEALSEKVNLQYKRIQDLIDNNLKRTPRLKNARHDS